MLCFTWSGPLSDCCLPNASTRLLFIYSERNYHTLAVFQGFPDSSIGKESAYNAGDPGSIPGLGRSAGEGKGYPLQYSGLRNSINCIVHGAAKSQTQLSDFHFTSLHRIKLLPSNLTTFQTKVKNIYRKQKYQHPTR